MDPHTFLVQCATDYSPKQDLLALGLKCKFEFGADRKRIRVQDKNALQTQVSDDGRSHSINDVISLFGLKPRSCSSVY